MQNSRYFTVLGSKVREELFRNSNPLGSYVRVGGQVTYEGPFPTSLRLTVTAS